METYIDGVRPETIFCRTCLVTIVVGGDPNRADYLERIESAKHLHERQNPQRHPKTERV